LHLTQPLDAPSFWLSEAQFCERGDVSSMIAESSITGAPHLTKRGDFLNHSFFIHHFSSNGA
jgi:hypothetical protein